MAVTRDYSKEKDSGIRRTSAHYVENGTTLCHIVWAILWVPMGVAAVAALFVSVIVYMHVDTYERYAYKYGAWAAFIPEGFVLATGLLAACIVFCLIGAGKVGFFKLLWLYLVSLKKRVCPVVSFGTGEKPHAIVD